MESMTGNPWQTLAERAGVAVEYVEQLRALGILPRRAEPDLVFDVRRVHVVDGLERGGLPLEAIASAIERGALSLDFVEQPSYDRFAAEVDVTFEQLSEQTGVPLELLLIVREATGSPQPGPADRARENELRVVPFLQTVLGAGVRPALVEHTLRVAGDGVRRLAETEADWWRSDILGPLFRSGSGVTEIGQRTAAFASDVSPVSDDALLALYHGQQAHAWLRNIFEGFESVLIQSGVHTRLDQPPAICFFDLAGYSRLTEERGDAEAADLAGRVARVVQRASVDHGGKPIKWLGDGVMLHFRAPGPAVRAALDMVDAATAAELPDAHVGIHAGPVLFQEGDYFGRTVNGAARIADHAAAGQILVSESVVEHAGSPDIAFEPLGSVELKGFLDPLDLYIAGRSIESSSEPS